MEGEILKMFGETLKQVTEINHKLNDLQFIKIINGSSDGTPTQFERNDFHQMQYNAIKHIPVIESKLNEHLENTAGKNLTKIGKWINDVGKPVVFAIVIIIVIFTAVSNFFRGQESDKMQQELKDALQKINKIEATTNK